MGIQISQGYFSSISIADSEVQQGSRSVGVEEPVWRGSTWCQVCMTMADVRRCQCLFTFRSELFERAQRILEQNFQSPFSS